MTVGFVGADLVSARNDNGGGKPGCMASRCALSFAGFSAKDSTDQPPPYNHSEPRRGIGFVGATLCGRPQIKLLSTV